MTNSFFVSPISIFVILISLALGLLIGFIFTIAALSDKEKRQKRISLKTQRSILGGKFSEHLAPYLPGFPQDLKPSEAKFLGDPVDFIIFKGLDDKNITEVIFLEVKSGHARFNHNEKMLKNAIDEKRVRYVSYNVPEEVTKIV